MSTLAWVAAGLAVAVVAWQMWLRVGVVSITTGQLKGRLDARERLVVLDVREPHEFSQGHIRGAVNLPLARLREGARRLNPEAETILVCQSGSRSLSAYHRLKRLGFTNLKNLDGGMLRWQVR